MTHLRSGMMLFSYLLVLMLLLVNPVDRQAANGTCGGHQYLFQLSMDHPRGNRVGMPWFQLVMLYQPLWCSRSYVPVQLPCPCLGISFDILEALMICIWVVI